jgi:cell wall-associated NlpC family hydrolase
MNAVALRSPLELIGVPYVRGGITPRDGFDCWSLVEYVRRVYFDLPSPLVDARARAGLAAAIRTIEAAKVSGEWVAIDPPGDAGSVVGMAFAGRLFLHHVGVSLGALGVLHAWAGIISNGRGSVTLTPWARIADRFKVVEVYAWRA